MKAIESKDNNIYKELIRLTRKKYRDERGLYLLEGPKPISDALDMGVDVERVFLCEGYEFPGLLKECIVKVLSKKLFTEVSQTETSQGITAIVKKTEHKLSELKTYIASGDNVLVVDRIQDPGNLGTMIRTSEAAGYKAIIVMKGSADVYSPKVVRAAAGSLFRIPVYRGEDEEQLIEALKQCGKKIISASPDTDTSCFHVDMTCDIALIIGNEGQGVSQGLSEASDIKIKIPMEGSIESLNAAVAAGILMYQSKKTK
ncbi:MAG: RNA methyltransferase [Clostridiales bacterium]|nr:RNA methyltransferase [Clostridiales bacterium]